MNSLIKLTPADEEAQLKHRLDVARQELLAAETALSKEQAAVNQFRMHCRLKIGDWVDRVVALRAERESLIAHLQINLMAIALWKQGERSAEDEEMYWEYETWLHGDDDLILPTDSPMDRESEKQLYRQLVKKFHPDKAESSERPYATTMMASINNAWQSGNMLTLRNLAGELDPELVKELTGGETAQIRRLRRHLLNCKRRKVRVSQQVKLLHKDNTTQLWRKACRIEEQGEKWWIMVREELDGEIGRLQIEINGLQKRRETIQQSS